MQNKERVFANKIDKPINNNEKVYYSNLNEELNITLPKIKKNINQKINEIFKSKNYVYKADVIIKTSQNELTKTIIGRNKDYIITNDNELIPIKDIKDIKRTK